MILKSIALAAAVLAAAPLSHAAESESVKTSIRQLYNDMNNHSLQALDYVSTDGFTEVSPTFPKPTHISREDMKVLLDSDTKIHLRVHDMAVTTVGDAAIVTGYRDGGIDRIKPISDDLSLQFTMVWTRGGSGWVLRHFHLARPNS